MKCLLCDINPAMRETWEKELERRPGPVAPCSVVAGGIMNLRVDAVVSSVDSFGFTRGGADGIYTRVLGEGVESRLQAIIRTLPAEELSVGEALIMPTGHSGIPQLISVPTIYGPSVLHDGDPARRSARVTVHTGLGQALVSIAFPGMGTEMGHLLFDAAAKAMFGGMEEAFFFPR